MDKFLKGFLSFVVTVACIAFLAGSVALLLTGAGAANRGAQGGTLDLDLMDRHDMRMTNRIADALDGVLAIEKVYWLSDDDMIAPEPNQEKYGTTTDPSSLGWLLEAAKEQFGIEETAFSTDVTLFPGSQIMYYMDETIFAITWKQQLDGGSYTFAEVKIAHPSQIRRYLAGGEYGSEIQLKTTQMAETVNAVVASSGDFYGYRRQGIIVYDGEVKRADSTHLDTCYIDDKGNMLFSYRGELKTVEEAQKFVDDNNIRFSLSFGPVLIDHGERKHVSSYLVGEINDVYPRAALCQKGELHYVVATVNIEGGYQRTADLNKFARRIEELNVDMAYTLDGGQTAVIAMNDQLINAVMKGNQRNISDIFYFATAVPDGE